ncbi:hypothetical protein [Agrobacterium tumefaciens]|uniref:hypothetical protein n=1 Tax=Agrobacterium tumefaciens TaxID=358 RepID=UPI000AE1B204|nr:hypothetical protein [Agrobacterium tumefaciens]
MDLNTLNRWTQKITISVDGQYIATAARLLGTSGSSIRHERNFIWTQATSHRGDDERVVWDLSVLLKDLPEDAWRIDWENSRY